MRLDFLFLLILHLFRLELILEFLCLGLLPFFCDLVFLLRLAPRICFLFL